MASAKAWLLERKSIYEVGFRDPAYFSRFFRKHAGAAPRQDERRAEFAKPA